MAEVYQQLLPKFYAMLGEALRHCQTVEHDIKMIWALFLPGDARNNLKSIEEEKKTLGEAIHAIKDIEQEKEAPFFSKSDYRILLTITRERNHFVHDTFNSFLFSRGEAGVEAFRAEYARLEYFLKAMQGIAASATKARVMAAKRFL